MDFQFLQPKMSSTEDEHEFCECDACLLGFDDTRPGEDVEPHHKQNNNTSVSDCFFPFYQFKTSFEHVEDVEGLAGY